MGHSPFHRNRAPGRDRIFAAPRSRRRASRNRTAELVVGSILAALFVLLGVGGMLVAMEQGLVFGPTPTPTPTTAPTVTPTADFRATQIAADFLTQVAYEIAQLRAELTAAGSATPMPPPTEPPLPEAPLTPETETTKPDTDAVETPEPTPTIIVTVLLPGIAAPDPTTPAPDPALFVPTPTPLPEASTPTDLPTPFVPEPPTATPSPIPTATPVPYLVSSLNARVIDSGAQVYVGPSNVYTVSGNLPGSDSVRLLGRTPSGEWVNVCCVNGAPVWVRQAYAPPSGNQLGPGAPPDAQADDVRWLPIAPVSSDLAPLPVPTEVPPGDFPMFGYDRRGSGRVPVLPRPPLTLTWSGIAQAAGPLTSPAILFGDGVLVGSSDQHLYSFDRNNGNQRWRLNVGGTLRVAPLVHDGEIFIVTESGRVMALADEGNSVRLIWDRQVGQPPYTGLNAYAGSLYVMGWRPEDNSPRLFELNRDNGTELRQANAELRPVIGDQLIYLASNTLRARDVRGNELVWGAEGISDLRATLVYGTPGVRALAELYAVDGTNRIFGMDANTGREVWRYDNFGNNEPIVALGLSEGAVLAAGAGYVKAISRSASPTQLWRTPLAGTVLGVPLNDGNLVLAVTDNGGVQLLDLRDGSMVGNALIQAQAGGAPAVGNGVIYVPGTDGRLYALRGN